MNSDYDSRAVELLMDSMDIGVLCVDTDRRIQICNRTAKEMTGIVIDVPTGHAAGKIQEGDIVVIADNCLGEDDGAWGAEELALLNVDNKDIKKGDVFVAAGVYGNKKIRPEYKYLRQHQLDIPLKLDVNYYGFHIAASIDTEKKETVIAVNGRAYQLSYHASVGNMVVIDGETGNVKFFQAKGYSTRKEDAGNLLRGQPYCGKTAESADVDVRGRCFLEFFDESLLTERLFAILDGSGEQVKNGLYEINKRLFLCNIVPWTIPDGGEKRGVFLMIQDTEQLEKLLEKRNEIFRQIEVKKNPEAAGYPEEAFTGFVGKSSKIREVKYMAYKASKNRFNVIITGESGTGKSKLAREIHMLSNPSAPFIEVNCNAIAPTLFESELFGYVGGAFTGAKSEGKIGFFEAADKGTIFLDEIGEIPLDIQVKLLHVLQNKIIYRVGSSRPVKVNVRVIAATNKNLESLVRAGKFRSDLYYRLYVLQLNLPPLRERQEDIPLLTQSFLRNFQAREGDGCPLELSDGDCRLLQSCPWRGNIRELQNFCERLAVLYRPGVSVSGLIAHLLESAASPETPPPCPPPMPKAAHTRIDLSYEELLAVLQECGGNRTQTAAKLGISRGTLWRLLKKYQVGQT
mgnify:CR=1 FL=1